MTREVMRSMKLSHFQPETEKCQAIESGVELPTMTPQEMIELLVCPACKKRLVLKDGGQGLKCMECRRVYPIRDDLPIMLIDEATVDPT